MDLRSLWYLPYSKVDCYKWPAKYFGEPSPGYITNLFGPRVIGYCVSRAVEAMDHARLHRNTVVLDDVVFEPNVLQGGTTTD